MADHRRVRSPAVVSSIRLATVQTCPAATSLNWSGRLPQEHQGATAACTAVKVRPPATIVPVRAEPGFASARKLTFPSPDPLEPAVTCNHESFEPAVHLQSSGVLTSKFPEAPVASTCTIEGLRMNRHSSPC